MNFGKYSLKLEIPSSVFELFKTWASVTNVDYSLVKNDGENVVVNTEVPIRYFKNQYGHQFLILNGYYLILEKQKRPRDYD